MFRLRRIQSILFSAVSCGTGLAFFCAPPTAAQKHFPTNEEIRQVRTASAPKLSPDGKTVVAEITDSTADGGRAHLWLLPVNGTEFRQLTFSKTPGGEDPSAEGADPDARARANRGEHNPEWMPDGSAILYLARSGKAQQMFSVKPAGGQPSMLQFHFTGMDRAPEIQSFAIAPNGKTIALVARDPEPTDADRRRKEKDDAHWVDHELRTSRLYLAELATKTATRVAFDHAAGDSDTDSPVWNSSSTELLAISHAPDNDLGQSNVGWIVSVGASGTSSAAPKRLTELPPAARHLLWAHGDRTIAYFAGCKADAPVECLDLYTDDPGTRAIRDLSAGFNGTLSIASASVEPDGAHVLLTAAVGVEEQVLRFDLNTGKYTRVDFGMPVVTAISSNAEHNGWTYLGADSQNAPNIYYRAVDAAKGQRLAQPDLIPANWQLAQSKVIHWKNQGMTIDGLIYLPPQAGKQKVPLIVNVHGGPSGVFNDRMSALVNLLVGQGWAVLEANPRGSTGYGAAFQAANKNDLGGGDYRDIMAGVDEAIRSFPIDSQRLALIGYSYGGEMAGFAEGKTDRFKAIVCAAPVIDQFSEYGTEDTSWSDRWYYGKAWEHFEDAWRQSPLATVQHAKTPFLLLQGEADITDPQGQSQEMYRALRQEGVPVEMVTYPRENHADLSTNFNGGTSMEPMHGVDVRRRIVEFIQHGFGGETAAR